MVVAPESAFRGRIRWLAPSVKAIRDAVGELVRHDVNDGGWTVTSLADYMNTSPTHAEWSSEAGHPP